MIPDASRYNPNAPGRDSYIGEVGPELGAFWTNQYGAAVIDCPNFYPFIANRDHAGAAIWLGYFFMGGHQNTPWAAPNDGLGGDQWISPQKTTDNGNLVLVSDENMYYNVSGASYAHVPHAQNGPLGGPDPTVGYSHVVYNNKPLTPAALGARQCGFDGWVCILEADQADGTLQYFSRGRTLDWLLVAAYSRREVLVRSTIADAPKGLLVYQSCQVCKLILIFIMGLDPAWFDRLEFVC